MNSGIVDRERLLRNYGAATTYSIVKPWMFIWTGCATTWIAASP